MTAGNGLNVSQEKAFKFLRGNFGLKAEEIEVSDEVPNFSTKDGRGYHPKKLFGKKCLFYPGEMEKLVANYDKNSLLLVSDDGQVKQVPARVLLEDSTRYEDYSFQQVEPQTFEATPNGDILLKISRRNHKSRHYRMNHIPIESILAKPEGSYEFRKSAVDGGMSFFLVLRPALM